MDLNGGKRVIAKCLHHDAIHTVAVEHRTHVVGNTATGQHDAVMRQAWCTHQNRRAKNTREKSTNLHAEEQSCCQQSAISVPAQCRPENATLQICIKPRRSIDEQQALPHVRRRECDYAGQLVDSLRRAHNAKQAFKAAMRRLALT